MSDMSRPLPLRFWLGAVVALVTLAAVLIGVFMFSSGSQRSAPAAGITADLAPPPADDAPPPKKPVFPAMKLEAIYRGPFEDTLIQRWRDPIDGRVCYLYIPVRVKHQPQTKPGAFIDYGANTLGTISCSGPAVLPATKPDGPPASPNK